MKRGTTALTKVMRGTTAIQKIMRGTTFIWENWIYYVGSLFEMTSLNTPSPFVASATGSGYPDGVWMVFNTNDDAWSPQTGTNFTAVIDLVNPVRMAEFTIKMNYQAYQIASFYVEASNDNSNWTTLWDSGGRGGSFTETHAVDSVVAYRYYRVRMWASSTTGWTWSRFTINKYYRKG